MNGIIGADLTDQYKWLAHGDCMSLMRSIPDSAVNMVLTDPPYGTTQNKWDSPVDLTALWSELERVCVDNAVIAMTASQPFSSALVMSNPKMFRHEWIWIKNRGSNFANTVREPMKEHESVLIFSKGKWIYNKQMQERSGGGVDRVRYAFEKDAPERTTNYGQFDFKRPGKLPNLRVPSSWQKFNCEVGIHPTQKPTPLFEYLIRTYTNEGDLIIDPFAGSATTAMAAHSLGRDWICIENDFEYHREATMRLYEAGALDVVWCESCGEAASTVVMDEASLCMPCSDLTLAT